MKQTNLVPYILTFASGLLVAQFIPSCSTKSNDFEITNNTISYQGMYHRPIRVQNEKIIVGTLEDRMRDIMDEPPGAVKRTAEILINRELQNGYR